MNFRGTHPGGSYAHILSRLPTPSYHPAAFDLLTHGLISTAEPRNLSPPFFLRDDIALMHRSLTVTRRSKYSLPFFTHVCSSNDASDAAVWIKYSLKMRVECRSRNSSQTAMVERQFGDQRAWA